MDEKKDQISKTVLSNNIIRSKSVIKYSSVSQTADFCCLQFNTNLNVAPPNWLSNEAESYGLRHMCSSSFSSFQIANMFSDYIGGVDVVSDAENIKNLLKIPYSKKSVSMMVHRIENTLLLDEFDINKHLMVQINDNWKWLRKFLDEHILEPSDKKEKCINCKVNTFDEIQQKSLYSKFLHYTIANSLNTTQKIKNSVNNQPLSSGPSLSEPIPEEVFPDDSKTHQLFNHYVLWDFEDLHMLLGTNLSVFRSGQNSTSFISSRLRNTSKPLSVLTAIDYWLDNLICDIPEVVTCYHLNGFVKKYGFVKTENLPTLDCSKFSPQVIKNAAQNLISFLKKNATKSGHTYWLFKGKNDKEIKLYNLTSICFESSIKGHYDGQNPFTVPVAMLLYRIARTLKYNSSEKTPYSPISIHILLDNCLKILNKIKFSHIVTSAHYILSDIYIPHNINPISPQLTDLINTKEDRVYSSENLSSISDSEKFTYFVNIQDLCLIPNNEKTSLKPQYSSPETIMKTLEERCYKALYHVGCGLHCLEYFSGNTQDMCGESTEEMIGVNELLKVKHRYCSYGLSSNEKIVNKSIKNKNRKRNKQSIIKNLDNSNISEIMYYKSIAENMSSWNNPPDPNDRDAWIQHFRVLFYEKACFSYAALAEHEYTCENYGKALKHFCSVFECHMVINKNNVCYNTYGFLFSRIGDCYLKIALNWNKADEFVNELETDEKYDLKVRNILDSECGCGNCILEEYKLIPDPCKSKEDMLKAAEYCFLQSLDIEIIEYNIDELYQRLSLVYNEFMLLLVDRILASVDEEVDLNPSEIQNVSDQIRNYTFLASDKYGINSDQSSLALINWNSGVVHRNISYHLIANDISTGKFKNDQDYINIALDSFKKSLALLGNRDFDTINWDNIYWDLSDTIFNLAIQYQNKLSILPDEDRAENEKEIINLLLQALKYCDVENDSLHKSIYQFRTAFIHKRLGFFYCSRLRCLEFNTTKFRSILHQCISHYNHAFEMFLLLNRLLDCLEVILEILILDLYLVENTASSKVKSIVSTVDTLKKCVPVLSNLLKNDSNSDINKVIIDVIDEHDFSNKEEELLIMLEDKLQFIFKVIIKQAMVKQSKLTDKLNDLKTIYGDLLKKNNDIDKCTHLLRIITRISELSL